jgi:hypothetical protein
MKKQTEHVSLEDSFICSATAFLSRATFRNPEAFDLVEDWLLNRRLKTVTPADYAQMKEINAIAMADAPMEERNEMLVFQSVVHIFSLTDSEVENFLDIVNK